MEVIIITRKFYSTVSYSTDTNTDTHTDIVVLPLYSQLQPLLKLMSFECRGSENT